MPLREMQRFAERTRQQYQRHVRDLSLLSTHRLRVVAQLEEIQHTLACLDTKIAHFHSVEIEQEQEAEMVGAKLKNWIEAVEKQKEGK